jgi:hypothetical protein
MLVPYRIPAIFHKTNGIMGEVAKQYISLASPDRKSLYANAIKTIEQQSGNNKEIPNVNIQKTLFDCLNERDGIKGMEFSRAYPFSGGGSVMAIHATGGGAHFEIAYAWQLVMVTGDDTSLLL